jgi:signal peptide peptidase SppA
METNQTVTELLLKGITVDGIPGWDGGRGQTIQYIDWATPANNHFSVINQFRVDCPPGYNSGKKFIVPDLVLLVNGIPMVVVECKSPSIPEPLAEAVDQLRRYSNQRKAAFEVEDAKAVALLIKSPGGSPAQAHLIYQRIRSLAAEHERPVFAFIEDVGASGGYMLACAADEIFADPTSIVGSIGVVSAGFGLTGLIEKLGVERRIYTAGASKAMLDPFLPEKAEDVARLKELQADVHDSFVTLVKASRGDRLNGPDAALFNGAFWTGRKALDLGLVDGLGDLRTVMRARFGDKVELELVPPPGRSGLLRFVLPSAGMADAGGAPLIRADDILAALETRALWGRYGL